MNVLVIGSGGREHVLCWKLKQSPLCDKIYCAPGNAGISQVAQCVPIETNELEKLADFAQANKIGLTVVGPEAPLCDGVVDVFKSRGLKVFGPDKYASQLEGSKDFAKKFMLKYDIPTAKSAVFFSTEAAATYIDQEFNSGEKGIVVKADGLAAGKGVLVANNATEAINFVRSCFDGAFGSSGSKVLIEECLFGEEASIFGLCDTKSIIPLASSQDHKRIFDNDQGPNTGGMGAYSPAPVVTNEVMEFVKSNVLANFLRGVKAEKLDFHGLIFVGIMVTDKGPKVLEFNVRFGDPEVQAVLRRLDSDLLEAILCVIDEKLENAKLIWSDDPAISVVIASGGYPGSYHKGHPISGLQEAEKAGAVVFHAGTAFNIKGEVVNTGGRVLGVSARGKTIKEAIENAYCGVDKISFSDCFSRRDIGAKALKKR